MEGVSLQICLAVIMFITTALSGLLPIKVGCQFISILILFRCFDHLQKREATIEFHRGY
jgi:hypothetical protein